MKVMAPITVLIADHEKTRRAACVRLLDHEEGIQVIGEARSGLEAIKATARFKPRILLLSLSLLKGKKIGLLSALRRKSPETKVILTTRHESKARILEALSHGARGFIEEKTLTAFLPKAVQRVDIGKAWVPRSMISRIINLLGPLASQVHECEEGDPLPLPVRERGGVDGKISNIFG